MLLKRAIASVTAQTRQDWELVVVDDNGLGSPEQRATEHTLNSFTHDKRIRYLPHDRNKGGAAARNTGIQYARGEFVAFLDDDDVWYPKKLETQVACFERAVAGTALVYGSICRVNEAGGRSLQRTDGTAHLWRNLLARNGIGSTSVVLCRRDALMAVGGFDEALPSMQDLDLYIRLAQRYPFAWVADVLMEHHRHGGPAIGKNLQSALHASRRFYEKYRVLLEDEPEIHHCRLREYAYAAVRAEAMAEGRRLLWRAWRLRRTDVATLLLALVANRPLLSGYRRVRRWWSTRQNVR